MSSNSSPLAHFFKSEQYAEARSFKNPYVLMNIIAAILVLMFVSVKASSQANLFITLTLLAFTTLVTFYVGTLTYASIYDSVTKMSPTSGIRARMFPLSGLVVYLVIAIVMSSIADSFLPLRR